MDDKMKIILYFAIHLATYTVQKFEETTGNFLNWSKKVFFILNKRKILYIVKKN